MATKWSKEAVEILYQPKLWFYDELKFLDSSTEARISKSNIPNLDTEPEPGLEEALEADELCGIDNNDSEKSHLTTQSSKQRKKTSSKNQADEALRIIREITKKKKFL